MPKKRFFIISKTYVVYSIMVLFVLIVMLILTSLIFVKKNSNESRINLAQQIENSCEGALKKEQCYINQFDVFSKKNGLKLTLNTLAEVQKNDPTANSCHAIAHKIANNEVSKNSGSWINLLSQINTQDCSMGFFHGIIEGHMQTNPNFLINERVMVDVCQDVKDLVAPLIKKIYFTECIHALAHMILVQEEADVERALLVCEKLEQELRQECDYGVFMEDSQRQTLQIHGFKSAWELGFEEKEFYINDCNKYDNVEHVACWMSKGWVFYRIEQASPEELYENCSKARIKEAFLRCYTKGLGVMVSTDKLQNLNKVPMTDFCIQIEDNNLYESCNRGLLGILLSLGSSFSEYGYSYCGLVKESYKKKCREFVDKVVRELKQREKIMVSNTRIS